MVVCFSLRFRIPLKVRASRTSFPYSLSPIYFLYYTLTQGMRNQPKNVTFCLLLLLLICYTHGLTSNWLARSTLFCETRKPSHQCFSSILNCNNQLDRLKSKAWWYSQRNWSSSSSINVGLSDVGEAHVGGETHGLGFWCSSSNSDSLLTFFVALSKSLLLLITSSVAVMGFRFDDDSPSSLPFSS